MYLICTRRQSKMSDVRLFQKINLEALEKVLQNIETAADKSAEEALKY